MPVHHAMSQAQMEKAPSLVGVEIADFQYLPTFGTAWLAGMVTFPRQPEVKLHRSYHTR